MDPEGRKSSGRGRKVADYFLVAGLPSENPQLLDENSLEVNLRATANQDPITDIAVIFPGLGENVPDYYQLIDATPSGLSANLNYGSFRAHEALLCYRRGRDKPPLLNVGVFFSGKDKMEPDYQILEFTPNGNSANVNNNHNSATYLTYRRSPEISPCNQLVVTDICVIIASKGEVPPHSFKKIDKTLNKGMLGADVYICVKRSVNRPDFISYKPGLLARFPTKDNDTYPLEELVALFCLPMGATLECWPSESTRSAATSSTFVLTLPSRSKVYGAAITFYEEYQESLLTDEQRNLLNLRNFKRKSDRKIFSNKCICLLSQWPFFEAFESFLFFLHKRQLMGPFDIPLERFISHFLYDVPFPSPERPRILAQLSSEEKIALFLPEELHLPRSGASFRNMLKTLGPENCLLLLLMVLTEQKILIHSLRPAVLTSVAEALMQIIFPFYWQCPYVPLCPVGMSDYLAAPMPFVMGFDSRFFDLYDLPEDVNAVDLDTNTVTICAEKKSFLTSKLLPRKPAKNLRNTLDHLLTKCGEQEKIARQMEITNDGAIDFVFKIKRQELQLEMEIREAFLHFLIQIMRGYGNFLRPITSAPSIDATDVDKLFDQIGFLKSRDSNYHKFYVLLMKTQMFTKFIEERSFVSETNTALAFFDECIHNYEIKEHHHDLQFLEIESFETDRTVLTLPPDANGLPKGSVYHYEKFDNLNPDLFEERGHTDELENGHKTPLKFATPSASTLARRTKYEIRSAQKSARKNAKDPFSWSICLVGTAYSLWFIHLPGMLTSSEEAERRLRMGLMYIQRMQRRLMMPKPGVDEICYRVMMQLCGKYGLPSLAVDILNEMTRFGEIPNAVTYGHYNKAVLESQWPDENQLDPQSQRMWRKLSIVTTACAILRKLGRSDMKGAFLTSVSQVEVKEVKKPSDTLSRSSQDSSLSRISSTDEKKSQEGEEKENKEPVDEIDTPNIKNREPLNTNNKKVSRALFPDDNWNDLSREASVTSMQSSDMRKSRSQSVESSDDGMVLLVDYETSKEPLPTVHEGSPLPNPNFLSPVTSPMHRASSSSSMKVPVTQNDPLGALSSANSPTNTLSPTKSPSHGMVKSATCPNDELFIQTAGSPVRLGSSTRTLDETEILGSPFSNDKMSRSTTMPVAPETPSSSFGGLLKSLNKSRLSNLKKNYFNSTGLMRSFASPKHSEALSSGLTSIRSAASSLSKRVGEQLGNAAMTPTSSNLHLNANEDATDGQPEDPETWGALTGQLWDTLWGGGGGSDPNSKSNSLSNRVSAKQMFDNFEEFYNKVPRSGIQNPVLVIEMTSCTRCLLCSTVLYDEEIMAGWTAEDSNLNTKCHTCGKMVVPFLTVRVVDLRRSETQPKINDIISVPYLSPLVLRKELETMLETEGDSCLANPQTVDEHPIIYWNMIWYNERIAVKSHLPSLCFKAKSLNPDPDTGSYTHHNILVECKWDNQNLYSAEERPPIYSQWSKNRGGNSTYITGSYLNEIISEQNHSELKPLMQQILHGVQHNDLEKPLKSLLDERLGCQKKASASEETPSSPHESPNKSKKKVYRSAYREIMFLTLVSIGQDNIDLTAFDREYGRAFSQLPPKYLNVAQKSDHPPEKQVTLCRKIFRELKI